MFCRRVGRSGAFAREDALLRRHDYAVDVLYGGQGANYPYDYKDCQGFKIPRRRLVYSRGNNNRHVPEPI